MLKFLENNILLLRAPEPEDLEVLYKWENDTDVWKYGTAISPYSRFILRQYIADSLTDIFHSKQLRLMIVLRKTNVVVGTIDLYDFDAINKKCGVGIYIDSEHRQNKLGYQALEVLQNYVFNYLKINQLHAVIPENNAASLQLFKSSGFSKSGTLQQWVSTTDGYEDAFILQKINLI